jgi:DNA repair protein RecO (recombination protein O)
MYLNTTGLVLRETAYKDSSKILTILTETEGKLTVSARGALRKNSKMAAVTQLLVYSELSLSSSHDRWTLTEARSIEQFTGLRNDLSLLSLASYFAELTEAASDEDSPSPELLPLCLNAFYVLSESKKAPEYVKPAFELRLAAITGFAPLVTHCAQCGRDDFDDGILDVEGGVVLCGNCSHTDGYPLSRGAIRAMDHIIECDRKKLFAFTLKDEPLRELYRAAEGYLLAHFDRRFRTLDYYNKFILY